MSGPSTALIFACYGGEAFAAWLRHTWDVGFGHGSELVKELGTPRDGKPGRTDNVYAAERLLAAAVADGWLLPGRELPTREQRYFGIGGQTRATGDATRGYSPNRDSNDYLMFVTGITKAPLS